MSTPKERLLQIMDEYSLTANRLAGLMGLKSSSSIYRYTGNSDLKEFDTTIFHRLTTTFPELNPKWLESGEGSMLREGQSFNPRQDIRGGHHNRNVQNNIQTSGYEKIIKPDGTVSIEPTGPQTGITKGAAEIMSENEMLRRENAELKGELKAKNEMIEQLLATIKGKE